MKKIRMKVGVGGIIGEHAHPKPGDVLEVEDAVAEAWADGVRAELVEQKPAAKKTAAKRTAKRATKTVETAAGESGPEKR